MLSRGEDEIVNYILIAMIVIIDESVYFLAFSLLPTYAHWVIMNVQIYAILPTDKLSLVLAVSYRKLLVLLGNIVHYTWKYCYLISLQSNRIVGKRLVTERGLVNVTFHVNTNQSKNAGRVDGRVGFTVHVESTASLIRCFSRSA